MYENDSKFTRKIVFVFVAKTKDDQNKSVIDETISRFLSADVIAPKNCKLQKKKIFLNNCIPRFYICEIRKN